MATLSSPTISWNMVYICWAHCCRLVWQHKFMHKAIQRIASPATLYSVFQCLCLSWSKPPTQPSFKHEKSKCSSMRVTGLWFEQMFNEKIQQQCCLSCTYNYLTYNHDLNGILWNVLRLFIYLFIFLYQNVTSVCNIIHWWGKKKEIPLEISQHQKSVHMSSARWGRWPPTIESVSARGFCLLKGSFISKCLLMGEMLGLCK